MERWRTRIYGCKFKPCVPSSAARRATVAAVGGLATLAYGAFLVATHASAVGRLTAFPLIALSFGYAESARAGL